MAWEYKIITSAEDTDDETMLNELGADNWELLSVQISEVTYAEENSENEEGDEYVEEVATYYLKRQK
ncbi:hypothetical protein [Armatimonas sp.]|uniref:hypothetical protein n=1 Tax=Armatimonas sp. TaxID=1872638 RepID=UPI003750145C